MSERIKAGIFDLDGTVRTKDGIPQSVLEGIQHLWNNDITTTFMTGRGYARLIESCGGNYDKLVSEGCQTPVGLETGGRIANRNGSHNLRYYPLKPDELVIVTANGNEKQAGTPKVLIVRAKKSDIDAFSEGTLDLDGFREKVQIVAPPRAKPAGDPEQATDKPDTAEGTKE